MFDLLFERTADVVWLFDPATATTLEVTRVSYWSLQEDGSAIVCESLCRVEMAGCDPQAKGARLTTSQCPAYFEALRAKRSIVADRVLTHPATRDLADAYLKPLGISSMLDAPVWVGGEVVGVLCHEHTSPARDWSSEEIDFASALAAMVTLALQECHRARSERLLRESEAKFRALFEGTSQAVLLHDETGILEVNPSCCRLSGYSGPEELIGRHPADLSAPIQPCGERAEVLAAKHIAIALAQGSARLSTAFRASPLNITILRLSDARFVEANDAFVRWFGLEREQLLGHDSCELDIWVSLDDREKFLDELRRQGSLREVECRLRSRRGTVHPCCNRPRSSRLTANRTS